MQDLRASTQVRFHSPHPPEECLRRLAESVAGGLFHRFSSRPLAGTATGTTLFVSKNKSYKNAFEICLNAEIRPEGRGTTIIGTLGPRLQGRYFLRLWFVGVAIVTLYLWYAIGDATDDAAFWTKVLIAPALLLFGWVMAAVCRYQARGEDEYLKRFIIELLDARETTGEN